MEITLSEKEVLHIYGDWFLFEIKTVRFIHRFLILFSQLFHNKTIPQTGKLMILRQQNL